MLAALPLRPPAALAALALLAAGCDGASPEDGGAGHDAGHDAGTDAGPSYDAGAITRIPESEASAGRTSCAYSRGAMPWQTLGAELPIGEDIRIDHFIILLQENRSFDHYFGTMPGVDGLPEGAQNPDAAGTPVEPFHTTDYCIVDVSHSWNGSHRQYNGGANDGFVVTNQPNGRRAMGYLDETDLPFYWDLARTFAFSDHHHCSMLGPTWVNRFYLLSGTSFGRISNGAVDTGRIPADGDHVVFEQLERAGVSWGVFHASVPFVFGGYPHYALRPQRRARVQPIDEFWAQLEAGTLPSVSYLDPVWDFAAGVEATDEHPPANPQLGQAWVREVVTRVMASPLWARTALIVTYDEHGGFYDHVPPPEACHPNDFPPDRGAGSAAGDFDRLGFRVPLWVVSPYARRGHVSPHVTDLASVLRLLQARYLLPALSGRDANAWPLLDMFDFDAPPRLEPPTLAPAPIDEARQQICRDNFH
ncbi:MAG: alkaline phosphatase family protein [Sandaracinaceae bacterium]|nr:alkaline phosphatase family protein [Sandaracinaceae bacterium]